MEPEQIMLASTTASAASVEKLGKCRKCLYNGSNYEHKILSKNRFTVCPLH